MFNQSAHFSPEFFAPLYFGLFGLPRRPRAGSNVGAARRQAGRACVLELVVGPRVGTFPPCFAYGAIVEEIEQPLAGRAEVLRAAAGRAAPAHDAIVTARGYVGVRAVAYVVEETHPVTADDDEDDDLLVLAAHLTAARRKGRGSKAARATTSRRFRNG